MHRCKICQAKTRVMSDIKKELSYYRCTQCGFVSLDDEKVLNSRDEKRHYEAHNNSFECKGYVEMFEQFIEKAVRPYLQDIEMALEFGCGSGPVLAELLSRMGIVVDKYDLYFYPEKVYEGKSYDLITSTEVFEHLKDPMKILTLLTQHLAKDGYLILMTKFPPLDDQAFLNWWYRRDVTHISFFTPTSFEIMAEQVGLRMVTTIDENMVVFQK